MHRALNSLVPLVLLGLGAFVLLEDRPAAKPGREKPAHTYGLGRTIPQAITGRNAKHVASYIGDVMADVADALERDGKQTKPIITRRVQLETLLSRLGQLACLMGSTDGAHVDLSGVLGRLFDENFPKGQGELTEAERSKAVELFRAVWYGCSQVR